MGPHSKWNRWNDWVYAGTVGFVTSTWLERKQPDTQSMGQPGSSTLEAAVGHYMKSKVGFMFESYRVAMRNGCYSTSAELLLTCKSGITPTLWVIAAIKWEYVETSRTVLCNGNNHSNNNKRRTVSIYLSVDTTGTMQAFQNTVSFNTSCFPRGHFHFCFIGRETEAWRVWATYQCTAKTWSCASESHGLGKEC